MNEKINTPSLARHSLFAGVVPEALRALEAVAELQTVSGGEPLVSQGDDADALYFVESGRFRVVVNKVRIVAHIEAGEALGELAIFLGEESAPPMSSPHVIPMFLKYREALLTRLHSNIRN